MLLKLYKSTLVAIKLQACINSVCHNVFTINCRCFTLALIYNFLIARCEWRSARLCAVRLTLRDVGLLTRWPTDSVSSATVNDDKRYTVRHLTSTDWLLLCACDFLIYFSLVLYKPKTACKLNLASPGWSAGLM